MELPEGRQTRTISSNFTARLRSPSIQFSLAQTIHFFGNASRGEAVLTKELALQT